MNSVKSRGRVSDRWTTGLNVGAKVASNCQPPQRSSEKKSMIYVHLVILIFVQIQNVI